MYNVATIFVVFLEVFYLFCLEACWKAGTCLQCSLEQSVSILDQVRLIIRSKQERDHYITYFHFTAEFLRSSLEKSNLYTGCFPCDSFFIITVVISEICIRQHLHYIRQGPSVF